LITFFGIVFPYDRELAARRKFPIISKIKVERIVIDVVRVGMRGVPI
jgi:hypothetical protein